MRSSILKLVTIIMLTALASCGSKKESGDDKSSKNTITAEEIRAMGGYRNTYYYMIYEDDYAGQPKDTPIKAMSDKVIVLVSAKFFKDIVMEGSGKLTDGRVLNWAGKKGGESRFRVSPNPDGDGVGACALVPFHSVAIDPTKIKLGSIVKIKETVGMKLPNGEIHDGIWQASDIGSAIKNDRVDLFIGAKKFSKVLDKQGITHMQPLDIQVVKAPGKDNCADMAPIAREE